MRFVQFAVAAIVFAGFYAWMSVALGALFAKLGHDRAVAWIPIARYASAARAAELPTRPVWIARSAAAGGWLVFVVVVLARSADPAAASDGLAAIAAVAFVVGLAGTLVGWVVWIVGANRIELRLGAERRLAWVAALLPPLWATIIGYGSARPVVAGPVEGVAPVAEYEEDDATRAIERVTVAQAPEPDAGEAPTAVEGSMTVDDYDVTGEYPRAFSPYDKAMAPTSAPSSAMSAVQGGDQQGLPWAYDDDDETFFAKRRRARWILRVVGGEEYDLEDITTIGREGIRPIPGVLPIIDDTRTMSKLHARLRRESDNWFITDLGSTNGTFVRDPAGVELEVKAQSEAKVNGTLLLGDLEVVIVDQREVA